MPSENRIMCSVCGVSVHIHDSLESYCLVCAAKQLLEIAKLQAENAFLKTQAGIVESDDILKAISEYKELKNIKAERDALQEPCVWKEDEEGVWMGTCGVAWEFTNDGPKENRCGFCPRCGHPIEAHEYTEPEATHD